MHVAEEIARKGPQVLRRFHQPLQHRVGSDLEDPRRSADTQALSQAGQDVHDEVDRHLFTVENRAVGLQKIPLAGRAVELAPGTATGMAIGPQIVHPQPAAIVTLGVGTKVLRGVHGTGASGRERHRIGPWRGRWRRLAGLSRT
jgi:hypothetical protein